MRNLEVRNLKAWRPALELMHEEVAANFVATSVDQMDDRFIRATYDQDLTDALLRWPRKRSLSPMRWARMQRSASVGGAMVISSRSRSLASGCYLVALSLSLSRGLSLYFSDIEISRERVLSK